MLDWPVIAKREGVPWRLGLCSRRIFYAKFSSDPRSYLSTGNQTYLSLRLIKPSLTCSRNIIHTGAFHPRKFPNPMNTVVRIACQNIAAFLGKRVRLAHQFQSAGCVGGEYDGILFKRCAEEGQDCGSRLFCAIRR